jgi:hypothetical protein
MSYESMSCRVVGLVEGILLSWFCLIRVCLAAGITEDSVMCCSDGI